MASEIFQRKLDEVLEGLPCIVRIVDDIIVWGDGDTTDEALHNHDHNLEKLLQKA